MRNDVYRWTDVFWIEKEFSEALSQLINQKDTYIKDFWQKSEESEEHKILNPKCVLIIWTISSLTKEQTKAFELFRNNLKDIEVVTFDELFTKMNLILEIFTQKKTKKWIK